MSEASNPPAFRVFYGDEEYLLDRAYQAGRALKNRAIITLDGDTATEQDLISAMSEVSFDEDLVTVVVDNAEQIKLGKFWAEYLENRHPNSPTSLFAVIRKKTLPKAWEWATEKAKVTSYFKLEPWKTDELKARVDAEAKRLGLTVHDSAHEIFQMAHKDDLRSIVNQLRKLTLIRPQGFAVAKEDALLVCPRKVDVVPWTIVENLFYGSVRRAFTQLSLLFEQEGDGAAVPVLFSFMKTVEQLLVARSLSDKNQPLEVIQDRLQLKPFPAKKLMGIVPRYTVSWLISQMKNLSTLEFQIKGSAPSKRTLMELAAISLSAPRKAPAHGDR